MNIKSSYIAGFLLGLSIASFIVFGIGLLNGWWLQSAFNNAIDLIFIYGVIALAIVILFIANLILTVVNIKHQAPPVAYWFAWGPVLLALLAFLILSAVQGAKKESYEQTHPNIQELHINLSGKSLWINQPTDTFLPNPPEQFVELTRYAGSDDKMLAYNGSRLAESFKDMSIYSSETESADNRVVVTLPIVKPKSYPDVSDIIPKVGKIVPGYKPTEASLWVYQYFYYADRIEVVPALILSGSDSMDLWGSDVPVVDVHVTNLQAQSIARLEIDGQTLAMKYQPYPIKNNADNCNASRFSSPALNALTAPIKVRWQFVEPNPQWHEAIVKVPQFPALKSKPVWSSRGDAIYLYFQKDGSVTSQWQQVVTLTGDKLGVRTTAILPKLKEPVPCGTADDSWADDVVRINH